MSNLISRIIVFILWYLTLFFSCWFAGFEITMLVAAAVGLMNLSMLGDSK